MKLSKERERSTRDRGLGDMRASQKCYDSQDPHERKKISMTVGYVKTGWNSTRSDWEVEPLSTSHRDAGMQSGPMRGLLQPFNHPFRRLPCTRTPTLKHSGGHKDAEEVAQLGCAYDPSPMKPAFKSGGILVCLATFMKRVRPVRVIKAQPYLNVTASPST